MELFDDRAIQDPKGPVVFSGRSATAEQAIAELEAAAPMVHAMRRGVRWLKAMQSRDGGWGAFDANNTREVLTKVPFADHNAMIDPSTADITARVLESFAGLGIRPDSEVHQRALDFIWKDQQPDHCWYGRWGVNYLYGTWQVIVGLVANGVSPSDPRINKGAEWLKNHQQECGGWGETANSYDDPTLRGTGVPTASQTAWALLGLIAAGEAHSTAVARGVSYLLSTQQPDGTWNETEFTGTGFPRVFYLKYHYYALYFPLMALARYAKTIR
jgi:squalene-hopene/tetraprenyl-beta-curcumene cyclase